MPRKQKTKPTEKLEKLIHNEPVPQKGRASMAHFFQEEAVQAIILQLTSYDRAHVVMACGTGKTHVALWAVERLQARIQLKKISAKGFKRR